MAVASAVAETVWFRDDATSAGLIYSWHSGHRERHLLPEIMGGGVALFDGDSDGDLDVFFPQAGVDLVTGQMTGRSQLFRNRGNGTFDNVSAGSGADISLYGMGVATGDYDGDGDPDLFVTGVGRTVLLRNDGGLRFTDVTPRARAQVDGWSTSAAFVDYDADGDLDLFVVRYIAWSPSRELPCYSLTGAPDYCSPRNYKAPTADVLLRNDSGAFTDVSAPAGLRDGAGNGLGVVTGDFDGNGRLDVFVANDATPNRLWLNQGGGRFLESAVRLGCAVDQDGVAKAGMGVDATDVDDDGDEDLLVMNLDGESDSFFRSTPTGFLDETARVGLRVASRPFTRFGLGVIDFDNDGRVDIYEAAGRVGLQSRRYGSDPYAEPSLVFRGTDTGFREVVLRGGRLSAAGVARGAAFGDLNNDGGVDVVVVERDAPARLLMNVASPRGHWLSLRVQDARGRDALGAVVSISVGGRRLRRLVRSAHSYLSASDQRIHLGLGAATRVEAVDVRWVSGPRERFGPFDVDRIVDVRAGRGRRVGD